VTSSSDSEQPLRRRSLLPTQPLRAASVISDDAIAAVASRNGFQSPIPVSAPQSVPSDAANEPSRELSRRQRQPSERKHQFNVRLKRETLNFIYDQANNRAIPVAQVIEDMADALKRQQKAVGEWE
jgi:hypothetical protein